MKRVTFVEHPDLWPEAVSDGLSLPCGRCGDIPKFDYIVDDTFWRTVVPDEHRLGVVCLPCMELMASVVGLADLADAILEVQFIGRGVTVVLEPTRIVYYSTKKETKGNDARRNN